MQFLSELRQEMLASAVNLCKNKNINSMQKHPEVMRLRTNENMRENNKFNGFHAYES